MPPVADSRRSTESATRPRFSRAERIAPENSKATRSVGRAYWQPRSRCTSATVLKGQLKEPSSAILNAFTEFESLCSGAGRAREVR